jgi:hypothetical protein
MKDLLTDKRQIKKIATQNEWWQLGTNGVTEILPVPESGQMALVPWFIVKRKSEVVTRVNAAFVMFVDYA